MICEAAILKDDREGKRDFVHGGLGHLFKPIFSFRQVQICKEIKESQRAMSRINRELVIWWQFLLWWHKTKPHFASCEVVRCDLIEAYVSVSESKYNNYATLKLRSI